LFSAFISPSARRLVYAIGILAAVHFFLQSKLNVAEPIVMAGLLAWLLGYRLLPETNGLPLRRLAQVAGLSLLVGFATLGGELAYYWLAFHADPLRLLDAAVSLRAGIRPGWIVLAIGALVTILAATRIAQRPAKPAAAMARPPPRTGASASSCRR
jgi:sulfoxide reductase heme-binding subunit YedZ